MEELSLNPRQECVSLRANVMNPFFKAIGK